MLLAAFDDALVVYDPVRGRVVTLNPSAAAVLLSCDGIRTADQIAAQLSEELAASGASGGAGSPGAGSGARQALAAEVATTLARLVAEGLVQPGARPAPWVDPPVAAEAAPVATARASGWIEWVQARMAERVWPLDRGIGLIDRVARVRVDDAQVAELVGPALPPGRPGAVPPGTAAEAETDLGAEAASVSLVSRTDRGRWRYRLLVEGRLVARGDDRVLAAEDVLHHVDQLAIEGTRGRLLFHAGAVERQGRVILVGGASGAGKSTLVASLVQHGWRYLTDEVVAVDPANRGVAPYPKALDLDEGALAQLGLDGPDVRLARVKAKVRVDRLGQASPGGVLAGLVVLGRADPAPEVSPARAGATATALTPAEALVALVPLTFAATATVADHFEATAGLCRDLPAVALARVGLADQRAAVEALLA